MVSFDTPMRSVSNCPENASFCDSNLMSRTILTTLILRLMHKCPFTSVVLGLLLEGCSQFSIHFVNPTD